MHVCMFTSHNIIQSSNDVVSNCPSVRFLKIVNDLFSNDLLTTNVSWFARLNAIMSGRQFSVCDKHNRWHTSHFDKGSDLNSPLSLSKRSLALFDKCTFKFMTVVGKTSLSPSIITSLQSKIQPLSSARLHSMHVFLHKNIFSIDVTFKRITIAIRKCRQSNTRWNTKTSCRLPMKRLRFVPEFHPTCLFLSFWTFSIVNVFYTCRQKDLTCQGVFDLEKWRFVLTNVTNKITTCFIWIILMCLDV